MKTDKDHNLIESLKKLIKFALNGSDCQREIFSSFNRSDFQKIMQHFEDSDNTVLRQLSFKLMSLLLSRSRENRNEFCKIFEIYPIKGRVVLNKLPSGLVASFNDPVAVITKLREGHFGSYRQMYLKIGNPDLLPLQHRDFPEDQFLDPCDSVIVTMVEDENPSPRKVAFFQERSSTPKHKNPKSSRSKEIEPSGTALSSPRESLHTSFSNKARQR